METTYTLPERKRWLLDRLRNLYCACAHAIDEERDVEKAWVEEIGELHKQLFNVGVTVPNFPSPFTWPTQPTPIPCQPQRGDVRYKTTITS